MVTGLACALGFDAFAESGSFVLACSRNKLREPKAKKNPAVAADPSS